MLGKYIDESGAPFLLIESGVLKKGSMNGFIKGKSYNKAKRIHQLLSVSIHILHFREFLNKQCDPLLYLTLQREIAEFNELENLTAVNISKELSSILEAYTSFCDRISTGNHGKTAQYWIEYINLVNLYHELSRSIISGDLELYIHCLPKLAEVFFASNHYNYAKWITKYRENLMSIDFTHPEVQGEFRNGCFSLKRTRKCFLSGPTDLALEQTISTDAASHRTCISSITNSISARKRWPSSTFKINLRNMPVARN